MTAQNSTPTAETGTIAPEMPWLVIREDGEVVSEHRSERAAVNRARTLGDGHTVRQTGRGRPRKDVERRTERVEVRITPSRKALWKRAADSADLSLADWLTEAGDAAAGGDEK